MSYRMIVSFGLIAGLKLPEMGKLTPGFVCDLYIYRQRYDDQEHGIKRTRRPRCED